MSGTSYFAKQTGSFNNEAESPLSPSAPTVTARNTALANKVTSVLSASYADSEIRDALGLLDIRGVENTAEARRRLRLDAQKEVIDCNAAVVQDFGKVAEQLKRIGTMISTLNNTCDEMRKHITTAKQETAPILEESIVLVAQKQEVENKEQLLKAFNRHFLLSDQEIFCLTSSAEPLDQQFFDSLTRAKKIHDDCEVLLENENQRLGVELMDETSRHINAAYKKLYTWIQKEFKTLDLEDPQIGSSVRKALRVLAERPSLFQSCLDFFAEAREHNLSHAFHAALIDPNAASNVVPDAKPIEFSTHDTLRYVGDMIAWVHSAAVSEREALEGLFISDGDELAKGIKAGQQTEPWSRLALKDEDGDNDGVIEDNVAFDGRAALASLVSRNLSGVTKTLKQRVEFAIRGNDDPVIVYKTMNLITFYLGIFSKLLGSDSALLELIKELQSSTFLHFERLMTDEVSEATNDAVLPEDLSVPTFLLNALDRISILLKAQASISFTPDTSTSSPTSLTRLLSVALTPFLDLCSELSASLPDPSSSAITDLPPDPSSPIFQLNYILSVRDTVTFFIPTDSPLLTTLTQKIDTITQTLTTIQHTYLLHSSALSPLLSTLPSLTPTTNNLPLPFQPTHLPTLAATLDSFLPTAHIDALENLSPLTDKTIQRSCTSQAVELFVIDFESVVTCMEDWDREHGIDYSHNDDDDDMMSLVSGVTRRTERTSAAGRTGTSGSGSGGVIGLRKMYPRRVEEVRVLLS
ncbi:putative golgi transport complex subunit cog6 [Phaeomoniella chlamydospora]|uniref:Conserved oligomeric Golgi complex subunit 6 n=1 Tax=Phaeomoniella chlamydospora TaxID=158046 RepID=A0A0G2EYQ1_PHACM|nr:putative golgi transport complex subunit cog6 [Phaeomoniella chlamydospora]